MSKSSHKKSKRIKQQQALTQLTQPALFHLLKRDVILGFLLFVCTLAAYQPAWNGQQLWDDDGHITKPALRSAEGLARIWTQLGATQQYYPLVHSVFWVEYHLWGDSTLGYHLVNILLHFLSALLLVNILRRLAIPGAWFVAAIFALHPVQVESVAWMTELKNMLSGVFYFLAVLVYLKFDRERKRKWYAIAISLFILGLMSKSVIATLPVSLLVLFWWKRGKINWKYDVIPLLPFFIVGIVSGLFTAWVERKFIGAEGSAFNFTFIERCLIAGHAIWFYLSKIFLPVDLIFIYPRWNINQAVWWQYLYPSATLILIFVLWTLRNRWRAPLAVFLYYTAMLFPVLGFFNVFPFKYSFVADHFQYLACIGPVVLTIIGMESALRFFNQNIRSFFKLTLYGILLLVLGAMTWNQSGMYSDIETLYRTTIRKNPSCWMARLGLGKILSKTGRVDEAISQYQKAIETKPDYIEARNNFGNLLRQIGQPEAAIAQYQAAIKINPNLAPAYNNLGITLAYMGRIDEAIAQYKKSLEIDPNKINAINNLAGAFVQRKQLNDAIPLLQRAYALAKAEGNESQARGIAANLEKINQEIRSSQKP